VVILIIHSEFTLITGLYLHASLLKFAAENLAKRKVELFTNDAFKLLWLKLSQTYLAEGLKPDMQTLGALCQDTLNDIQDESDQRDQVELINAVATRVEAPDPHATWAETASELEAATNRSVGRLLIASACNLSEEDNTLVYTINTNLLDEQDHMLPDKPDVQTKRRPPRFVRPGSGWML